MKKLFTFTQRMGNKLLWLCVIVLCSGGLTAASAQVDLEEIVDRHFYRTDGEVIPGMMVGAWEGDQQLVRMELGFSDLGLGSSGQVTIQWTDQMRIASLTKSFTVTRILQLAAEGELDLDTPITHYSGPGGIDLGGVNFRNGVAPTLRQLANMTSGLYNYSNDPTFITNWVDDLKRPWEAQELIGYANGPVSTAGWEYSNTNTVLLGMVIEAVTGNSIKTEIETLVQNAGLSTEAYYPQDEHFQGTGGVAHGYNYDYEEGAFVDYTDTNPSGAGAAGAMVATMDDLKDWAKVLATGITLGGDSLFPGDGDGDWQSERLGWITPDGSGPYYDLYAMGIGSINGWLGHTGEFLGYQHLMMYDPATDRTIVIMMNRAGFADGSHVPTDLFKELSTALAIPEPSSVALFLTAGGAAWWFLRRRKTDA